MFHMTLRRFLTAACLVPALAYAHVTGPTVDLTVSDADGKPVKITAAEKTKTVVYFTLVDKKTGKLVTDKDLDLVHERKFHLFAFDQSLTNYVHDHPKEVLGKPGVWRLTVTFAQTGQYKLWADILRNDITHDPPTTPPTPGMEHAEGEEVDGSAIEVTGSTLPNPTPTSLAVVLKAKAGNSILRLADVEHPESDTLPLARDQMEMILLQFTRADGTPAHIVDYLGAAAHITITNLAGDKIIHAHPMIMAGKLMLHTEFPEAGDYRLFAQFIDRDQPLPSGVPQDPPPDLKTVELSVHVDAD